MADSPAPAASERGVVGGVVHGRVGVDPAAALTADPGDHGDEAFVVHELQLGPRGRSGHGPLDPLAEAGRLDALEDRSEPVGSLWVTAAEVVVEVPLVGQQEHGHATRHDRRRHYRCPHDGASHLVGR